MKNYQHAMQLIREFSGQENLITIPRIFIDFVGGDIETALFLSQIIFWSDKGNSEFFYKSYSDWENCLGLSEYKVRKAAKCLISMGFLQTVVRKVSGNPTLHYCLDFENFSVSLLKFFQERNRKNFRNETEKTSGTKPKKLQEPLYTEITTEITTETNFSETNQDPPFYSPKSVKADLPGSKNEQADPNFSGSKNQSTDSIPKVIDSPQKPNLPGFALESAKKDLETDYRSTEVSNLSEAAETQFKECLDGQPCHGITSPKTRALKGKLTDPFWEKLLDCYNGSKPHLWARANSLNENRLKSLRKYRADLGDPGLLEAVGFACLFVAQDKFWGSKSMGIDNLLRENRLLEFSEKWQIVEESQGIHRVLSDPGNIREIETRQKMADFCQDLKQKYGNNNGN